MQASGLPASDANGSASASGSGGDASTAPVTSAKATRSSRELPVSGDRDRKERDQERPHGGERHREKGVKEKERERDKDKDRDREREREPSRRRSGSRERSHARERSRDRERDRHASRSRRRSGSRERARDGGGRDGDRGRSRRRSRSRSKSRSRSRDRDRRRHERDRRSRSRSRSRSRDRHGRSRRSRSRSRDRPPPGSGVADLLAKVIGGGLMGTAALPVYMPPPVPVVPVQAALPPPTLAPAATAGIAVAPAPAAAAPPASASEVGASGEGESGAASAEVSATTTQAPAAAPAPADGAAPAAAAPAAPTPAEIQATLMARVQALQASVGGPVAVFGAPAQPLANKLVRELYVGGLPTGAGITSNHLKEFFNLVMGQMGLSKSPGNPVMAVRMAEGGNFAFMELRTPEECDAAVSLDGIPFLGTPLRVGRPKAYVQQFGNLPATVVVSSGLVSTAATLPPGASVGLAALGGGPLGVGIAPPPSLGVGGLGIASLTGVAPTVGGGAAAAASAGAAAPGAATGPAAGATAGAGAPPPAAPAQDMTPTDVILVSNLPSFMGAPELEQMMAPFGPIAKCVMITDPSGGASAGQALVAYTNAALIDGVLAGLNGLPVGDTPLKLSRAPAHLVASALGASFCPPGCPAALAAAAAAAAPTPTRVLELSNIVVVQDVSSSSAEELSEIREEVAEECGKAGRVVNVFIPPLTVAQRAAGQEQTSVPVYVLMESVAAAQACATMLKGRKFDRRTVGVAYVTEARLRELEESATDKEDSAGGWSTVGGDAGDEDAAEAAGVEGGHPHGHRYGGAAIPPPDALKQNGGNAAPMPPPFTAPAPEDGMALPAAPSLADID